MGLLDDLLWVADKAEKGYRIYKTAERMGLFDNNNNSSNYQQQNNYQQQYNYQPQNNYQNDYVPQDNIHLFNTEILRSPLSGYVTKDFYISNGFHYVKENQKLCDVQCQDGIHSITTHLDGAIVKSYISEGTYINAGDPIYKIKDVYEKSLLWTINSPTDGIVIEVHYDGPGPYRANQPLLTISAGGRLFNISANYPPSFYLKGSLVEEGEYVEKDEQLLALYWDEELVNDIIELGACESYCPIPYTGTITKIYVTYGEWVEAGDNLVQINVNGHLYDIQSSISEHIAKVYVQPGSFVRAGDTFLSYIMDPPEP